MPKLKFILFTFSLVIFLLVNNSCSVYKKKYSKGYTVSWHKNTHLKSKSSIDTNTNQNTNTEYTTDFENISPYITSEQTEEQDTEKTKYNTSELDRIDKATADEIIALEIEDVQHEAPPKIETQLENEPEVIDSEKVNQAAIVSLVSILLLYILTIISFTALITFPMLWIFLAVLFILYIIANISVFKALIQIKKQPKKYSKEIAILSLVLISIPMLLALIVIIIL